MNANEMVIIARLATLYEDHGVENPLDNAEHDIRELKRGAPELWRRIYDSEMSDRAIGDWAYDFFMREIQSGMSLKNFAADELEALDKVSTNIPHPVREAIRMNTFKKRPRVADYSSRDANIEVFFPDERFARSHQGWVGAIAIHAPLIAQGPFSGGYHMLWGPIRTSDYREIEGRIYAKLGNAVQVSLVERPRTTIDDMQEHRVADFNTLDDLAEHAARELGATHILYVDDEIHIYFPRQDGLFEKAEVWQKDGYWHAQGPGSRVVVRKLPVGAKPIESGREREEGPHSWKPGMGAALVRTHARRAGLRTTHLVAESPLDVLRTLQPGDMVTVESRELPRPRKLVVTHVSQHADSVYVTSGQVRPGHRSGGRLHAHGNEVFYDATIQQRPVRVSRLTRTAAALAERRR